MDCASKRSLFGIIRSCLSTVFVCTWVSIHPNIPPKGRRVGVALLKRVNAMIWMVIAPELILAWAVRQWVAARRVRKIYNDEHESGPQWTMEHGHFLIMGGYILVDPVDPNTNSTPQSRVMSFELFEKLVKDPNFKFPSLSVHEIRDKSKSDLLAKVIAISQTTWFITECIVRTAQNLGVTELELTTVALASLNAITFFFWWNKPFGVEEPVKIYLDSTLPPPTIPVSRLYDAEFIRRKNIKVTFKDVSDAKRDTLDRMAEFWYTENIVGSLIQFPIKAAFYLAFHVVACFGFAMVLLFQIFTLSPRFPSFPGASNPLAVSSFLFYQYQSMHLGRIFPECLELVRQPSSKRISITIMLLVWFVGIPGCLLALIMTFGSFMSLFLIFIGPLVVYSAMYPVIATTTVKPCVSHVPTFYAPNSMSDYFSRVIVLASSGVLFGGIHCFAWNFIYPTHFELIFWRTSSLVITVVPIFAASFTVLVSNAELDHRTDGQIPAGYRPEDDQQGAKIGLVSLSDKMFFTELGASFMLLFYISARLLLIGQAIALLRAQPPTVFQEIDWTKYFPHI